VSAAAISAGLPEADVEMLIGAMMTGNATFLSEVANTNMNILPAAFKASHDVYAAAYRLAWASIIPFVVLAIVAVACLKGVKELMTEHVDAPVEVVHEAVGEKHV